MTSQTTDIAALPRLRNTPSQAGWRFTFWPTAVHPGFYGQYWGGTLHITSNDYASCERRASAEGVVWMLDTGGLPEAAACAFGFIHTNVILAELQQLPSSALQTISVSLVVAQQLGWDEQTEVCNWPVQIQPGEAPTFVDRLMQRLKFGMALGAGQGIIFLGPALIFGWIVALVSVIGVLAISFLLALTWPILPGKAMIKGLSLGCVLACTGTLTWLIVDQIPINIINLVVAAILVSLWISLVFTGIKKT
jgi:hypothetical protein